MRPILIVYYSRTGVTRRVAEQIARRVGADAVAIRDVRSRDGVLGYVRSAMEAMHGTLPEIELPPEDNAFSLNCLAVAPGRVIMHETRTPRLAERLDKAGIEVLTIDYECVELGGGGIHCSTGPLARDPL